MEHLAIMRKSWGLLPKILSGEKVIESRWYKNKYSPWGKINKDDVVYFKNSGEPVSVKAVASDVLAFSDLTPKKVSEILNDYGQKDGIAKSDLDKYYEMFRDKKYCLLVFLKQSEKITPFEINKKGYGAMAAWITVNNIMDIKR